jgi:hypothetical protein
MDRERLIIPKHEPTIEELEEALRFSPLDLGSALEEQGELFYRVAKMMAVAIAERDTAKLELDETQASVLLKIRDEFANEKVTVDEVNAMVTVDRAVKQKKAKLNAASERHGKVRALKEAFEQRSYSIKDLVELQTRAGSIDIEIDRQRIREGVNRVRREHQSRAEQSRDSNRRHRNQED